MSESYATEQEAFWAGGFGDQYVDRNTIDVGVPARTAIFSRVLSRTTGVKTVLELGANIGVNMRAVKHLLPKSELTAVEINERAANDLKSWGGVKEVISDSILTFEPEQTWDFVFISGVLIHINPDSLPNVYDLMYRASNKYIMVCEYYNPSPVEIDYRGHSGKLFKRDFAGELWDKYPDLKLLDYAFCWRRDPNFPQDDVTWFLFEKG